MQHADIYDILKQYWGYGSYRPLQEEIINSVLEGKDTLALLPTGGGKSVCFQVPALAVNGLCLVVSPLIALMKDQVENLRNRGIKADALYSGQSSYEQMRIIDNVIYNDTKFLYVSPERLKTDLFLLNIEKLKISIVAVDEAHCISQWGYDFRPSYLEIANIRQFLPDVPVLALTATATPNVVEDIQNKLLFREKNVLKKSFERKNLSYLVYKEENKLGRLLRIVKNVQGTGIVYMRNRRGTVEIAKFLNDNKISADYYHAGLESGARDVKQESWKKGKTRIIVATNAFGMGIDKPDVRFVVHLDIPDNLEAYFQEVGRGGRDEKPSFGVLLYNENDIDNLSKRFEETFPDVKVIQDVYVSLGNFYQLAIGGGKNATFDFDMSKFSETYNYRSSIVYNSLKILELQGAISLTDAFENPSKLVVKMKREVLYDYQLRHPDLDSFIQIILRTYGGVFSEYVKIDETLLSNRSNIKVDEVRSILNYLSKQDVIEYIPYSDSPKITFVEELMDRKNLFTDTEGYKRRKKSAKDRLDYMLAYISNETKCRSNMLLLYFGEDKGGVRCGICDYCRRRNKVGLGAYEFDNMLSVVKPQLSENELTMEEIYSLVPNVEQEKLVRMMRWLIEYEKVTVSDKGRYRWNKSR